jgi:hypothetical protein
MSDAGCRSPAQSGIRHPASFIQGAFFITLLALLLLHG